MRDGLGSFNNLKLFPKAPPARHAHFRQFWKGGTSTAVEVRGQFPAEGRRLVRSTYVEAVPTRNCVMPAAAMLSARQRQLVAAVERLTEQAGGVPPTCREIAAEMGIHFTRAHQLIGSAAARGAVTRDPNKARSVRVVHRQSR